MQARNPRRSGAASPPAWAMAVVLLLAGIVGAIAPAPSPAAAAPASVPAPVVTAVGAAPALAAPSSTASPVVAAASSGRGSGHWLATADGGVFTAGDAAFHGSAGGTRLNKPIVGMAATPSGGGYWLVASDGGIFAFGDAAFAGSTGALRLNRPIVGMAATPSGRGYWLVASDGGIFAFGDAAFAGSTGAMRLNSPIVGMAASPTGQGYWLVASDGGVFAFGDAGFHGSATAAVGTADRAVGIAGHGGGYRVATAGGRLHGFGPVPALVAPATTARPVVAFASRPDGAGGWLVAQPAPVAPPVVAPAPAPGTPSAEVAPAGSGSGRRIVYDGTRNRVWLVRADNTVERSYLVSGRRGTPAAGTYRVFSKSPVAYAGHDGITMRHMVRFAHGSDLAIGFHSIPVYRNGRPLQSEAELGQFRSSGCIRQRNSDAEFLYGWAPVGTTVVVIR